MFISIVSASLLLPFVLSSDVDLDGAIVRKQGFSVIGRLTADGDSNYMGYTVNSGGDVNADGYDDFLISAPGILHPFIAPNNFFRRWKWSRYCFSYFRSDRNHERC